MSNIGDRLYGMAKFYDEKKRKLRQEKEDKDK